MSYEGEKRALFMKHRVVWAAGFITMGRQIYDQQVVSSTPSQFAINWLLGWLTVCKRETDLVQNHAPMSNSVFRPDWD